MSRLLLTTLFALLALVGLADSIYLTWDHGTHLIDPASLSGSLCGADGGCSISRESSWSEVPVGGDVGLPISLLGAAFYVVFLVLSFWDHKVRPKLNKPATTSRLQFILVIAAMIYSVALLGYSISQGSICKFCVVLYIVNTALLVLTWRNLGEKANQALSNLKETLFSAPAILSTILFVVVTGIGFSSYGSSVREAQGELRLARQTAMADSVNFDLGAQPTKGPKDAPLKLVEYFDFECVTARRPLTSTTPSCSSALTSASPTSTIPWMVLATTPSLAPLANVVAAN